MLKHERLMCFFCAKNTNLHEFVMEIYYRCIYIYAYTYMFRTPQEKSPFPILHPQLLHFFSRHFQHVGNPNITKML